MITIEQIKNIVKDIKNDTEWVGDCHSMVEYEGICGGLDRLVNHLEEVSDVS
tara:strand:- start:510 stop:665 length:156 start_codon:yes stop_codon:yes gene_type:complete